MEIEYLLVLFLVLALVSPALGLSFKPSGNWTDSRVAAKLRDVVTAGEGQPMPIKPPQPELEIVGLSITPKYPTVGEMAKVSIVIRNVGKVGFEGMIKISLSVDGNRVKEQAMNEELDTGEEKKIEMGGVVFGEEGEHSAMINVGYETRDYSSGVSKNLGFYVGPTSETKNEEPTQATMRSKLSWFLVIVAAGIIASIITLAYVMKKRQGRTAPAGYHAGVELDALQKKKRELEDMIKIAKVKFYKRKLDEDSYKEIVKDNQEKLIEIEAQINEIEKRVSRLETKR